MRTWLGKISSRVLGRFEGRRADKGAAHCALCCAYTGTTGPAETADHLVGECPVSAPWVAEHLGPRVRDGGAVAATDRALGGRGGHEALCSGLRLAGKLAKEVSKATKLAAEMEEYRATLAWSATIWGAGELVMPDQPEDPPEGAVAMMSEP